MADNLPSRRNISREALEKIIQRAAELQAGEMDTGESMTEAELLKLGAEVGIDGRHLRQALYEQGSGGTQETGMLVRWFGPKAVTAGRVVSGGKPMVDAALQHWMEDGEALAVKRKLPDRIVWERQRGFMAEMKRGFKMGGRRYMLAKAHDVTGVVTQLEEGFCHVQLVADVSHARSAAIGGSLAGGGAMAIVGIATMGLLASTFPLSLLGLIPLGGAVAAPAITGRAQRVKDEQMQLALEQVLDRLESGEIKPKHRELGPAPFIQIAEQIRGAITEGIEQSKQKRLKR